MLITSCCAIDRALISSHRPRWGARRPREGVPRRRRRAGRHCSRAMLADQRPPSSFVRRPLIQPAPEGQRVCLHEAHRGGRFALSTFARESCTFAASRIRWQWRASERRYVRVTSSSTCPLQGSSESTERAPEAKQRTGARVNLCASKVSRHRRCGHDRGRPWSQQNRIRISGVDSSWSTTTRTSGA